MKKCFWPILIFCVVIVVWYWTTANGYVSPILFPSPLDTLMFLIISLKDRLLADALLVTLIRLFIGYFLGLVLGLILGFLLSQNQTIRGTLGVAALGFQTLPSVCWAPLAILWFGQTEYAMYFVVVMGSMWAIAIAAENAIRAVSSLYIRAARVMGSRGIHTWRTVTFPAALPQILSGAKLGWAFAWRSLMAAEVYVTIIDNMGLGQLLHFGRELNAMDQVLGVIVVIIAVGVITDHLIFKPIEHYLRRTYGV